MLSYGNFMRRKFSSQYLISKNSWRNSRFCAVVCLVAQFHSCYSNKCQAQGNIYSNKICRKHNSLNFRNKVSSPQFCTMEIKEEYTSLEKIGVLNNDNILIKDKSKVDKIVSKIIQDNFQNLQFVVDFDYTLTRGHFNNEKSVCSWGILDNSPLLPSFYRERAGELWKKSYPIEIDPTLSEKEKIPHMIEWYEGAVRLLKECGLSKKSISQMVSSSNVKFRDYTDQMFSKLKSEAVPTLIFSAGMGDVLEHVLWHFDLYSDNVKVVSNFFDYNENGMVLGFKGDLIHMFNKNENAIHSSDYFGQLKHRTNVVLMGDSLGDVKMAVGVPQGSNVLKIGFYNHDTISDRINPYLENYDIVLVRDQTMTVPNAILGQMK